MCLPMVICIQTYFFLNLYIHVCIRAYCSSVSHIPLLLHSRCSCVPDVRRKGVVIAGCLIYLHPPSRKRRCSRALRKRWAGYGEVDEKVLQPFPLHYNAAQCTTSHHTTLHYATLHSTTVRYATTH